MDLLQSLNLNHAAQIAIVGAGGKTTALFSLARQVEGPAWVTTTTHLGTDQTDFADLHCVLESPTDFQPDRCKHQKVTLLTGTYSNDIRIHSPASELLELIHLTSLREGIPLIIEADGSRSIPLKAPGEYEPVIPAWVTHVLVLVGMSALGKPLSPETVFHAERYSELTGLPMGGTITMESICKMLLHPLGGLKNIPAGAQKVVLFNQADSLEAKELVRSASSALLEGGYDRVIVGGLQSAPDGLECYQK